MPGVWVCQPSPTVTCVRVLTLGLSFPELDLWGFMKAQAQNQLLRGGAASGLNHLRFSA